MVVGKSGVSGSVRGAAITAPEHIADQDSATVLALALRERAATRVVDPERDRGRGDAEHEQRSAGAGQRVEDVAARVVLLFLIVRDRLVVVALLELRLRDASADGAREERGAADRRERDAGPEEAPAQALLLVAAGARPHRAGLGVGGAERLRVAPRAPAAAH